MASSSYKRAASFVKKAAKPPAKTVVFSLMAFLIVAAAPWMIIQTDAVSEDSVYQLVDQEYEDSNGEIIDPIAPGMYCRGGTWYSPVDPVIITLSDSFDDNYHLSFDPASTDDKSNSDTQFRLNFSGYQDFFKDNKIRRVVFTTDEPLVTQVYSMGFEFEPQVDDEGNRTGRFVLDLSTADYYSVISGSPKDHFIHLFMIPIDENGVSDFSFNIEFYSLEDDYTGSIIAFVAGIGLVVLAVLSTNFVNPTRWGKRRN